MDWSNWSDIATVGGSVFTVLTGVLVGIRLLMVSPLRKSLETFERRSDERHRATDQRITDLIVRMDSMDTRLEARMNSLSASVEKAIYAFFTKGRAQD